MKDWRRRRWPGWRLLWLVLAWPGPSATPAEAHTLRGTEVATLARLQVDHRAVAGSYEVQYGELAALEERRRMDTDGDSRVSVGEWRAYTERLARQLEGGLDLRLDGEPVPVRLGEVEATPGEELVAPERMTVRFPLVPIPGDFTEPHALELSDGSAPARLVHADIVIEGMPLVDIAEIGPPAGVVKLVQVQAAAAPVRAAVRLSPSQVLWADPFAAAGWSAGAAAGQPQAAPSRENLGARRPTLRVGARRPQPPKRLARVLG